MTTNFNFQLTGKKLFPLWIVYYLLVIVPYVVFALLFPSYKNEIPSRSPAGIIIVGSAIVMACIALIWELYFIKIILQNIYFNSTMLRCNYKIGKFVKLVLINLFFTIITIGIYSPWFIRNMQRYFINNTAYKENSFSFQGKGGKLFILMLLTMIIPMIIFVTFIVKVLGITINNESFIIRFIYQVIFYIILTPYIYYIYKWFVDVTYKGYHFKWDTKALPSIGKIAYELILSMITLGIYFPLAWIRLYKYFLEKTKSQTEGTPKIQFNYDIDQQKDYLFILIQTLLTIITLGIYFPWSFCKVSQRILEKTSMEKMEG